MIALSPPINQQPAAATHATGTPRKVEPRLLDSLTSHAAPYVTRGEAEAVFLVHRRHRLTVLVNARRRALFAFPDSPALQADVAQFNGGGVVVAADLVRPVNIVRKAVRAAHNRQRALERQIVEQAAVGAR